MTDQIILDFVNASLIDLKGDDTKLEKLRQTAADIVEELKTAPTKAVSYALVAFDPLIPDDEPVIQEIAAALRKRWATYSNVFSGTPIVVCRAVVLEALIQAASENESIGTALVMLARNVLPNMEAGNEEKIWTKAVTSLEQRLDKRAEAEWATPEMIIVPRMTFQPPSAIEVSASPVRIDTEALREGIEAAAGPQNKNNEKTGGNPYCPHNNPQEWVGEFGNRLSEILAEALSAVAKGAETGPIDLSGPLESLTEVVSAHVDETLKAVSGATAGLQRRTNLIWWKESLYSPSARLSYRDIPPFTAAALMAFDLHRQIPVFSPASIAAFLNETVLSLPALDADKPRPIRELLEEVADSDKLLPLHNTAADLLPAPKGRGPLLGLIGHGAGRSALDDRRFREIVGVPAETPLTVPKWAMWIFRELQAVRATRQVPKPAKQEREA